VAWSTDFIAQVNANPSLRVDFIAIHWYGWNAGSCEANASTLEGHIRKIGSKFGYRRAPTTTSVAWAPPVPFTASASSLT
jgi:hypothetical protein